MKHRFEGIGDKAATATMLLLAAEPWGVWFTVGFQGTVVHWILKQFYMWMADRGLIMLNSGIAEIEVMQQKSGFNGSLEDAFKLIDQAKGGLTDAQKKAIDDKVIRAFDKFADFGVRNVQPPGPPSSDNSTSIG